MRKSMIALATMSALACGSASAAIDIYNAALLGVNECGGSPLTCGTFGDPDGYGGATVMINNLTNEVSWMFYALNVETPTRGHIHAGAAGANGPIVVTFFEPVSAGPTSGTVNAPGAASITPGNAMDFYVNLHTASYPGGAIRGQLMFAKTVNPPVPEPETYAMMLAGLGVVGWAARRRRAAAA